MLQNAFDLHLAIIGIFIKTLVLSIFKWPPKTGFTVYFKTLCRQMGISIQVNTIKKGWSIVYTEGSQVMIFK